MANERQKTPMSEGAKGPADFQQLLRLRDEANKPGAPPQAVESLRHFLAERPMLVDEVEIMAASTRSALVNKIGDQPALRVLVEAELKGIRDRLGYSPESGEIERLLIAQICLAWLRLQWTEYQASGQAMSAGGTIQVLMCWERRLVLAQKRFTRAIESLAKVRKLTERKPTAKASVALIEALTRDAAVRGLRQAQYDAAGRALAGRFGAEG